MVALMPVCELSSCWQKWSRKSEMSSMKHQKASASAKRAFCGSWRLEEAREVVGDGERGTRGGSEVPLERLWKEGQAGGRDRGASCEAAFA
jgi:hypothetical protein